jgi:hypothetical protein
LISSVATGMVYEIAGGAPLYVSNWAAIGGARSSVGIDQWDLDNISNPAAHLNSVPTNGTVLGSSGGGVFVVAGGAPLFVSNWDAIGGIQNYVPIDQWDIDNVTNPAAHLHAVPADGTFLTTISTSTYRIVGGNPLTISACSAVGGCAGAVLVDAWDITNITNPAAHLNPVPADGSAVEAIPSSAYWVFGGGRVTRTEPVAGAVQVNDSSLKPFPVNPTITRVKPGRVARGSSNVALMIRGTGFKKGIAGAVSGSRVTVVSVVRVSARQVTVTVSVASKATKGSRTLTLVNKDGGRAIGAVKIT